MNFAFVQNNPSYFEFIRNCRNDLDIIGGFVNQSYISEADQKRYMQKYEKNYFVCLSNNQPVGFIGIINQDLRLAVIPEFQRKGVATFMLQELMKLQNDFDILVKKDNIKSINFFKKNNFEVSETTYKKGLPLYKLRRTLK